MKRKPLVVFLVGPTAVGKSEVAIELAKKINGEIISCDSMQVYKGMDIITQPPSAKLKAQVAHYLIGFLPPDRNFSAADFRKKALAVIKDMHKRKKIPIIVGGSGLYIKALVDGLFPGPPADEKLRQRFLNKEKRHGRGFIYNMLKEKDPQTASKIHPNDLRRTIRALEICEKTKIPMSQLKKQTQGIGKVYNFKLIGLTMPRQQIYKKTDDRAEKMFEAGLVDEVKSLKRYRLSKTASFALGIKELNGYLDGTYSLEEAKALIKRNTRRFVKKQLTWFRPEKRIKWIKIKPAQDPKDIANKIRKILKG